MKITYYPFTAAAEAAMDDAGISVEDYILSFFPDGDWRGDACGCPDDQCRDGYHHEWDEDCPCLESLLRL